MALPIIDTIVGAGIVAAGVVVANSGSNSAPSVGKAFEPYLAGLGIAFIGTAFLVAGAAGFFEMIKCHKADACLHGDAAQCERIGWRVPPPAAAGSSSTTTAEPTGP